MKIENEILVQASSLFKAVSDPNRLAIVYHLSLKEMNVTMIAETLAMEQSAVSHQLKILKYARLIKSRPEGKTRIYSLMDEHVYQLISQVMSHVQEKRD